MYQEKIIYQLIKIICYKYNKLIDPHHAMIQFLLSVLTGDIAVKAHVTDTDGVTLEKISVAPVISGGESTI